MVRAERRIRQNPRATFVLVGIDVVNFKGVNDTGGHRFGDLILRLCAGRLRRQNDLVGRLGGDEFAVLADVTGDVLPYSGRHRRTTEATPKDMAEYHAQRLMNLRDPIIEMYPELDEGPARFALAAGGVVYDRGIPFGANLHAADMITASVQARLHDDFGQYRKAT